MNTILPMISDILLLAACLGAAAYCMILSRRLARLNSVDKGLGGAIAVLSVQVDDLTKALADARSGSEAVADRLSKLMTDAETMANEIEEMLAVSHDFVPPDEAAEDEDAEAEAGAIADAPDSTAKAEKPEAGGEKTEIPVFRRRAVQEAAE